MNEKSNSFSLSCPLPITQFETIQLGHGSGGQMMHDLIREVFIQQLDNPYLTPQNDQAVFELNGKRFALSTDSFVVDPIFFPGGNIGELAINGTINDVAMCGARPLFLTAAFIIEEGLAIADLQRIVHAMQQAARSANVLIVTGDTKVVNKGQCDKIFINTTGFGVIEHLWEISPKSIRPGDDILLNGGIAEHGIAIISRREGLAFETPVQSDCAALHELVQVILAAGGEAVHAMRDPTRGGLAATLNEFVNDSRIGIEIVEDHVPVLPEVAGACEILGFDPMYIANEGKLVIVVDPEKTESVLQAMRNHPLGRNSAHIGTVVESHPQRVTVKTRIGGQRILDMPVGEILPRIC